MRLVAGEKIVTFHEAQKLIKVKLKEGHNVEARYSKYTDQVMVIWGE